MEPQNWGSLTDTNEIAARPIQKRRLHIQGTWLYSDMCCLCAFSCYGIALRKKHMAGHDVIDVLDETLEDTEW